MAIATSPRNDDPEYSDFEELWIAACAVYPVLRWPLTVQIGQELARRKSKPVPDLDAHVPLARHTWFRAGRIPDKARAALIDGLASDDRRIVHAVYRKIFQRMEGARLHDPLSMMDQDDPLFSRFMQGERWGARARERDSRLWQRLRVPKEMVDVRGLTGLAIAVGLALVFAASIFTATSDWREAGEQAGAAIELPAMVALPGGVFQMGSPDAAEQSPEWPQHPVKVPPFAIGKFEVTIGQYDAFLEASGHRPNGKCFVWNSDVRSWQEVSANADTGRFADPDTVNSSDTNRHPATCVSWDDAHAYLKWLNALTGLTESPERYRLPTEAEWEYAARAGNLGEYYWSDAGTEKSPEPCGYANHADQTAKESGQLDPGWTFSDCSDGHVLTAPVGAFHPNAFGLHDMSGNVWEWVEDCWHDTYQGAPTDGSARLSGQDGNCSPRVLRGGSWNIIPQVLRSANRDGFEPGYRFNYFGFRPARTLLTP